MTYITIAPVGQRHHWRREWFSSFGDWLNNKNPGQSPAETYRDPVKSMQRTGERYPR